MARPPLDAIGRVTEGPMIGLFVKVHDDYPGGIYLFSCRRPDFTGEGWDNWFNSWEDIERFLENQVGTIEWSETDRVP